jgi:hypothetical protein
MSLINRITASILGNSSVTTPVEGEIVDSPPQGFFTLRYRGAPDVLAHNSLAFGLIYPVNKEFTVGGQRFTLDPNCKLKVYIKPTPQTAGSFTVGEVQCKDTWTGPDEFIYEPLR